MAAYRLTQEEIQHIALIYRLGVSQDDIESFRDQLSAIIDNFQILDQVDTTNVAPTGHSVIIESVMREDESLSSMPKEDTLANAPSRFQDFFRVKAVLD